MNNLKLYEIITRFTIKNYFEKQYVLYNYKTNWTIFLRILLDQLKWLRGAKSHFLGLIIKILNFSTQYKKNFKNFGPPTLACSFAPELSHSIALIHVWCWPPHPSMQLRPYNVSFNCIDSCLLLAPPPWHVASPLLIVSFN